MWKSAGGPEISGFFLPTRVWRKGGSFPPENPGSGTPQVFPVESTEKWKEGYFLLLMLVVISLTFSA